MKRKDQETAEGILFTDQYQLTMAQLYYRMGLHEKRVQFDHFFRDYPDYGPHRAGYCITAGLEWLIDWLQSVHFRQTDINYLRQQTGRSGAPVFADDFLAWLQNSSPVPFADLDMWAIPEGRVVHANVPVGSYLATLGCLGSVAETIGRLSPPPTYVLPRLSGWTEKFHKSG